MNEFGEFPSIYVSPVDHVEGEPYPEHFWDVLNDALTEVGIEWETV